eukprot:CAMPEP_0202417648 /NCGR_PEP_ID=MMETSP1128-20130828/43714_1 /ASSEMBLY_ACC=CAM_ASM_000463 /TAXON_ID=3047 /ORGANISM="Dunaliella tertiolecta, Strain CCMP1320" /LENGTH=37 /DNA_ID= /DNA_START= /DNA_END= /DNA_ORIENTATION=
MATAKPCLARPARAQVVAPVRASGAVGEIVDKLKTLT